ncbi:hypothetical protein IQ287_31805 [Burkholderia sp. R-69927]|nr:hypothetical protein [Burkholderia sp. R-69927]
MATDFDAVLFEGDTAHLASLSKALAARPGPIVGIQARASGAFAAQPGSTFEYSLDRLLSERTISVNTAAAGGNANLMTIG